MSDNLQIIWHGHSCFEIFSEDVQLVLDPYEEVPGYAPLDLKADLVLASHEHSDHNARSRVKLSGRKPEIKVDVINSFHDDAAGSLRGENKIHLISLAGKRIAHCGDLGHPLAKSELDLLQKLDLLIIPVGGHYTIDAAVAAQIVRELQPDVTIPMHYREGVAGFDVITTVEPFLSYFNKVEKIAKSSFTLGDYHNCIVVLRNPIEL